MERRGFLKGLFGGVTAAGIVVAASPREIMAFTSPLAEGAPIALDMPADPVIAPGEHLYNAAGELVAIIRVLNVRQEAIDVTMADNTGPVYLPGVRHVTIVAEGVCTFDWPRGDRAFPRLLGTPSRLFTKA